MSKKDYYTYISNDTTSSYDLNIYEDYPSVLDVDLIKIHKDHASLLDINFELGELVETYNGELGIVIERLSNISDIDTSDLCSAMYKVQVGDQTQFWMGLSLKKIKKPLDR